MSSRSGPAPKRRNAMVTSPTFTVRLGPRNATSPASCEPGTASVIGSVVLVAFVAALAAVVGDLVAWSEPPPHDAASTALRTATNTHRFDRMHTLSRAARRRMSDADQGLVREGSCVKLASACSVLPCRLLGIVVVHDDVGVIGRLGRIEVQLLGGSVGGCGVVARRQRRTRTSPGL